MLNTRGKFNSRLGFVMAAAGSAVGLGNIWGFPTQAASNGGGAFLLIYLILTLFLAYPVLIAELVIGRHARANPVTALQFVARGPVSRFLGGLAGYYGVLVASLILSFYAIVGGWMLAHFVQSLAILLGLERIASWCVTFTVPRNILFTFAFILITLHIVGRGVEAGIERWSKRLMPLLLALLIALIFYVLTLPGAQEGLNIYLVPEFASALSPNLILKALGATFFSLSLGVGTMLVYGSYVDDQEHLPSLGALVAAVDVCIAVLAGFLILPAMYVALAAGVEIFAADGSLLAEDTLIFTVLPALFEKMGAIGWGLALVFFSLMSVASLTSSISMLEVPVALAIEKTEQARTRMALVIGLSIFLISIIIILNFGALFGAVISLTTRYSQPLIGMVFCLYVAWVWHRADLLSAMSKGASNMPASLFWKIWPPYLKYVCPVIIAGIILQSGLS